MVRLLDAKGHSTRWTFDLSGRVTQKTYHDGTTESRSPPYPTASTVHQ